jgi:hypothetical protein
MSYIFVVDVVVIVLKAHYASDIHIIKFFRNVKHMLNYVLIKGLKLVSCLAAKESSTGCAVMCTPTKGSIMKKMLYFDFHTKYLFTMIVPIANKAKEAMIVHLQGNECFLETMTRYQKSEDFVI